MVGNWHWPWTQLKPEIQMVTRHEPVIVNDWDGLLPQYALGPDKMYQIVNTGLGTTEKPALAVITAGVEGQAEYAKMAEQARVARLNAIRAFRSGAQAGIRAIMDGNPNVFNSRSNAIDIVEVVKGWVDIRAELNALLALDLDLNLDLLEGRMSPSMEMDEYET